MPTKGTALTAGFVRSESVLSSKPKTSGRALPHIPGAGGLYLAGATVPSVTLLVVVGMPWTLRIALIAISTSCCAALARRRDLDVRTVVVAISTVVLVAIACPPRASHDLWSYVEYGRMLGIKGVSPYVHTPAQFPHDPFLHLVTWRGTPSVYGPAFTAFSALGALLAGPSFLVARLWHQFAAAGALTGALVLVWRRTHDPRNLVWLGLHPLIAVSVVNGGHNDLLVGVLLALAVVTLADGHDTRAGAIAGVAALIKITAGLGVIGAVAWAWTHRGHRSALRVGAGAVAIGAIELIPFGLHPLDALGMHAGLVSRASVWQVWSAAQRAFSAPALHDVRLLGGIAVVSLALWVAHRRRADADPTVTVSGAVASFEAAGPYVLPWYAAWSLPALAFRREDPLARWAWWWAAVLLALYELPRDPVRTAGGMQRAVVGIVLPMVALVSFVVSSRRGVRFNDDRSPGAGTAPRVARR